MKKQKLISNLGEVLLIIVLTLFNLEPYFRKDFYLWFLFSSAAFWVLCWELLFYIFRNRIGHSTIWSKLVNLVVKWTITTFLGTFFNYGLLKFLSRNSFSNPTLSITKFLMIWVLGLSLLLSWNGLLTIIRYLCSSNKTVIKFILRAALVIIVILLIVSFSVFTIIHLKYQPKIYSLFDIPSADAGILFGAGIYESEALSAILMERVMTGSELIQLSKVNYLLMSGDGRGDLNEVDAMINAAMQNGMPKDALVEDLYGFSTLDTCVNAARNFNVNNAILISQKFHLPRALYLCETVGIDSKGVIADKKVYSPMNSLLWFFREVFATTYSWLSIQFLRK